VLAPVTDGGETCSQIARRLWKMWVYTFFYGEPIYPVNLNDVPYSVMTSVHVAVVSCRTYSTHDPRCSAAADGAFHTASTKTYTRYDSTI